MNAESLALPVGRTGLSEHYKQVESFQRDRARAAARISKGLAVVAGIAILVLGVPAGLLGAVLPMSLRAADQAGYQSNGLKT